MDLTLPAERVHEVADVVVAHLNATIIELRRLYFVEDFVDTLKFGILLWCLTYLGSWFNGMTVLIFGKFCKFLKCSVFCFNISHTKYVVYRML